MTETRRPAAVIARGHVHQRLDRDAIDRDTAHRRLERRVHERIARRGSRDI
jgi:hypothetical protein